MADARGESFQLALTVLREQLRTGEFRPGERLAAVGLAEQFRLSATPVREALSRLAGEGLIEDRRRQGYFARSLSGMDVADLYRISLAHLILALRPGRTPPAAPRDHGAEAPRAPSVRADADAISEVEQMLLHSVLAAGGRALAASYDRIGIQLGPVRRLEPLLFHDLGEEAARLRAGLNYPEPADRLSAVRRFHGRRIAAAARLAGLLDRVLPPA